MANEPAAQPNEPIAATDTDAAPWGVERVLYPMRLVGAATCLIVAGIYLRRFGGWHHYYGVLLLVMLTYSHLAHVIYRRTRSHAVEIGALMLDCFLLGSTVYVVGFSLLPALTLPIIIVSVGLAVDGPRFMAFCALSALAGTKQRLGEWLADHPDVVQPDEVFDSRLVREDR